MSLSAAHNHRRVQKPCPEGVVLPASVKRTFTLRLTAVMLVASQHREAIMYAVVRTYSGQGANSLFNLLEQRKAEIESISSVIAVTVGHPQWPATWLMLMPCSER